MINYRLEANRAISLLVAQSINRPTPDLQTQLFGQDARAVSLLRPETQAYLTQKALARLQAAKPQTGCGFDIQNG